MGGRERDSLDKIQNFLDDNSSTLEVIGPYINSKTKLPCSCKKCGYIWDTLSTSLRLLGGCPKCNGRVLKTIEELQIILKEKNFKIISEPSYYKLEVVCEICGYLWVAARACVLTNGCAGCSRKVKGSLEKTQLVLQADNRNIKVTGLYENAFSKLSCECLVCNNTWSAHSHNLLNGKRGCPSCALTGFDPSKPGYLYYLRVVENNQIYWKIGITNLGVKARFRPSDREKISVLYCHLFENGTDAETCERNILSMFKEYRAKNVKILQTGNTELFVKDVLQMNHLNWRTI